MRKTLLALSFLVFLVLPSALPIFKPYVSGTADGIGHRFRLYSFIQSLNSGNIRPRWAKEAALGYGAPTFLFNYPLPYYIASLFFFFTKSINLSGQLLIFVSLLLSAIFMFLLGKELFGYIGGFVSSIIYTYAPYHLQMIYLYDAWGEALGFCFPPLILYLSLKLAKAKKVPGIYFVLLVFSSALFILSHNFSALLYTPILLLLGFILTYPSLNKFIFLAHTIILGIAISAFFWLPAISLLPHIGWPKFLAIEGANRSTFFKPFLFQVNTAFQVIKLGSTHYLDFTVGFPVLTLTLLALPLSLMNLFQNSFQKPKAKHDVKFKLSLLKRVHCILLAKTIRSLFKTGVRHLHILVENKRYVSVGLILIGLILLSFYGNTPYSNWMWLLPPFKYLVYPFRLILITTFSGALLGGLVAKRSLLAAIFFCLFAYFQGYPYTNPRIDRFPFDENYYSLTQPVTYPPFTWKNMGVKEYLPSTASIPFLQQQEERLLSQFYASGKFPPSEEIAVVEGSGEISDISSRPERLSFNVNAKSNLTLLIHQHSFPCWEVYLDQAQTPSANDSVGRIIIQVPQGKHTLQLLFGLNPIEKGALLLTVFGVLATIFEAYWLFHPHQKSLTSPLKTILAPPFKL